MRFRALFPLFGCALLLASCTVVKPVACGIVHPIRSIAALFEESSSEPDEVDDAPTFVALVELPFVLPVFYVYKTFVGVIGGLATGLVSDFNVVTGHASWDKSVENVTRPGKTNADR
ncbi:MAG: hypothetical protein IPK67_14500 [Planctomycetes bacterium]|jgi:hypothetical protein|nr:hypothetical protein [Planctomycetota bacterium]